MKRLRTVFVATVAAGALISSLIGCGGQEPIGQSQSALVGQQGGPAKRIFAALRSLQLSEQQLATVGRLEAEFKKEAAPLKSEAIALGNEVARQIRAGQLQDDVIMQRVQKVQQLIAAKKPKLAAALNTLHQTLDRSQREALVKKLRADAKKAREGQPWKMRKKIRGLAKQLGINTEQRQKLRTIVGSQLKGRNFRAHRQARRQQMRKLAEAFVSDSFDATTLPFMKGKSPKMAARVRKVLGVGKLAIVILDQAQRNSLATLIENRVKLIAAR